MPIKKRKVPTPKAAPPQRSIVQALSVLVCHEKHEKRYFVVADDSDLFKHSLAILRGRLISDWYQDPGDKPEDLDYVKEDVERMPRSFRDQAYEKLRRHESALRDWVRENEMWLMVNESSSNADGVLAWSVLCSRNDREHERVSLETANLPYEYTIRDEDRDPFEEGN